MPLPPYETTVRKKWDDEQKVFKQYTEYKHYDAVSFFLDADHQAHKLGAKLLTIMLQWRLPYLHNTNTNQMKSGHCLQENAQVRVGGVVQLVEPLPSM